jgi:hypothetical protein
MCWKIFTGWHRAKIFFWAIIEIFLKLEVMKSSTRDWLELFKPTTFHVGGDEVE